MKGRGLHNRLNMLNLEPIDLVYYYNLISRTE